MQLTIYFDFFFAFQFAIVQFVDYGNFAPVMRDQLRKDLVGLDIPLLCFKVVLHGIKLTSTFDAYFVHEQFEGTPLKVELMSAPTKQPLEVKIHFDKEDLASILVKRGMATYI